MLELMARCGLRIGELLNIRASDVYERRLTIKTPKSGNESEVAFVPEQVAKRLSEYITRKGCLLIPVYSPSATLRQGHSSKSWEANYRLPFLPTTSEDILPPMQAVTEYR